MDGGINLASLTLSVDLRILKSSSLTSGTRHARLGELMRRESEGNCVPATVALLPRRGRIASSMRASTRSASTGRQRPRRRLAVRAA